jgi:hypothetical protein
LWALVAAFWLAARALARQPFGIVLLENVALCLVFLLLVPLLNASAIAHVFRSGGAARPLLWPQSYPPGALDALLLFWALPVLVTAGIATGIAAADFVRQSRAPAPVQAPLTTPALIVPGLVVVGVLLLTNLVAFWFGIHVSPQLIRDYPLG